MQTNIKFNPWEVAEIELLYKSKVKTSQRPKIGCSKDMVAILRENWNPLQIELCEQFKIILLNRGSRAIGIVDISSGGVSHTLADPKLIFSAALKALASSIIIAHNHPSGNRNASQADISLTDKLVKAGKLLDIQVLDHIILTAESYFSFADEGML